METHDRGTMKWVSLMLPEHVALLKGVFEERQEKPFLDEQKQMEIDQKLKDSVAFQLEVTITYYKNSGCTTLRGKIEHINQWKGYIVVSNGEGDFIPLKDIVDINR
ncbi:MAG TPA: YolD-like family protein [Pseudogracilibacillus sp.]|nr:YolD-like family protein [Pseudogracilibacillus sp.]